MGEGFWSYGCRNDVEYKGYSGLGSYYRSRFGTHWVGGGIYQKFAEGGRFECYGHPFLGAPVKGYGWIAEMNYGQGCYGQWFENGAVGYHDGAWRIMYGQYGQTGGMSFASIKHLLGRRKPRASAEVPPDPPMEPPTTKEQKA